MQSAAGLCAVSTVVVDECDHGVAMVWPWCDHGVTMVCDRCAVCDALLVEFAGDVAAAERLALNVCTRSCVVNVRKCIQL